MVVHVRPVAMQPALAGKQRAGAVRRRARLAQRRPALGAGHAMAAARHEHHDHVVADSQVGHVLAQCFDDARRFMARAPSASAVAGRR